MAYIHKIIFVTLILVYSCKDNKEAIDLGIASFSELQCRAVQLNERRFELFDQIRKLEVDTVLNKNEIDSLNQLAQKVKNESLATADTLKIKLSDFLTSQKFSDKDKAYVDARINEIVEKCKNGL